MQKGGRLLSSPHISAAKELQDGFRIGLTLSDDPLRAIPDPYFGAAGRLHN